MGNYFLLASVIRLDIYTDVVYYIDVTHETPTPSIFNPDGSINEGILNQQYGLGIEEAMQEVKFDEYTGTVAEMLADGRCPVGGRMRTAYETTGIDGVLEQFQALSVMDPNFKVEITEETIERNHVKKN